MLGWQAWRRWRADRTLGARPGAATLVAIARDERPYLAEWLAHHLAIGFTRIVVYDNDSADGSAAMIARIAARDLRVRLVRWPTPASGSPQVAAYRHAIPRVATPWLMILDIDEFLVPHGYADLAGLIAAIPEDVASLHVNWVGFGASGLTEPGYGLVTRAFTRCAEPGWANHHHFKTLARRDRITDVLIHDIHTTHGRRVLADFAPFDNATVGSSQRVSHAGVQINHYQCKTLPEFQKRMRRGDANYVPSHPGRHRDDSARRFAELDRNEREDRSVHRFAAAFEREYAALRAIGGVS